MRLAACDDDAAVLKTVQTVISGKEKGGDISVAAYQTSAALLSALEDGQHFDLYLLDILMPGMNGLALAHAIRRTDEAAGIVFLTSSPEFAVDSYDVNAMGYLLKPLVPERLTLILEKAWLRLSAQREAELLLSEGGRLRSVPVSAIECVEALHNKLIYHLAGGEAIETYGTITEAAARLCPDRRFIQPHRSYLVNMDYIRELDGRGIVLAGGLPAVPVSRGNAPALKERYIEYMIHMAGGAHNAS